MSTTTLPAHPLARLIHVTHPMEPWRAARFIPARAGQCVTDALGTRRLPPATLLLRRGADGRYAPVKRAAWDAEGLAADETALLVTLPQGGRQSNPLALLAMIAVAALAAVAGPAVATALGYSATGSVAAAATVAIATAGNILVQAILPPPQAALPKTSTGLSPTYALAAQSNRARIGEAIPEIFGRHIVFCDLAAEPWFDFDAQGNQRLYQVFAVGRGLYDIDEIRVAETAVWAGGGATGAYPEIELQIVPPGGTVTLFDDNVATSAEVSGVLMPGPNEDPAWRGPFIVNPSGTRVNAIGIDVVLPTGLFEINGQDTLARTVSFVFEAQPIDDAGAASGDWAEILREDITRNVRAPQRISYRCYVAPGRYRVRGRRLNNTAGSQLIAETLQWGTMRGFMPQLATYGDATIVAIKARATEALNGQTAQRFNVIARRRLPSWSAEGGFAAAAATRSPAWAGLHVARRMVPDSRIDLPAFAALAASAAARGDTFDGVFDQQRPAWEVLQAILRVTRAQAVLAGSTISVIRDEPRSVPRCAFTPRQIRRGTFSFDHVLADADSADSVIVEYVDGTTWNPAEITCVPPGSPGLKPARVQLLGVTSRAQAWREGQYIARASAFRRAFCGFSTELDGRVVFRGDLVRVSHPLPQWGQHADILSIDGEWLVLDAALTPLADDVAAVIAPDGRTLGPVACTVSADGQRVRLDAPLTGPGRFGSVAIGNWTVGNPPVSVWTGRTERPRLLYGTSATWARELLVVSARPSGADTVDLVLVADDARVHADPGAVPAAPAPASPPALALAITGVSDTYSGTTGAVLLQLVFAGAADATSFMIRMRPQNGAWSAWTEGLPRTAGGIAVIAGTVSLEARAVAGTTVGAVFATSLTVPSNPGT